ncbi:MAG: Lpg1974 family pore-forming outer membrane protein [Gammaproteobacteria bacterium]
MKNKLFLYSLTSLAVTAAASAHADEGAYVPTLEGGLTASVGTFLVTPTSDFQDYQFLYEDDNSFETVENVNPGYQLGIDASLGYIFEETANSVELFFRNINTSDSGSAVGATKPDVPNHFAYGDLGYGLNSFDLMFSQFVNLGEVMQLRLSGGLGFLQLKTNENASYYDAAGGWRFYGLLSR